MCTNVSIAFCAADAYSHGSSIFVTEIYLKNLGCVNLDNSKSTLTDTGALRTIKTTFYKCPFAVFWCSTLIIRVRRTLFLFKILRGCCSYTIRAILMFANNVVNVVENNASTRYTYRQTTFSVSEGKVTVRKRTLVGALLIKSKVQNPKLSPK